MLHHSSRTGWTVYEAKAKEINAASNATLESVKEEDEEDDDGHHHKEDGEEDEASSSLHQDDAPVVV